MRVFVTGATGFIGFHIVRELVSNGHQVLGLTRSESGAQSLQEAGAEVLVGDVEDVEVIRQGATASDGVIHTAFNHNFANFLANCASDRKVIESFGVVLGGTSKPLIITSAIAVVHTVPGQPALEENGPKISTMSPRSASEEGAAAAAAHGVNVSVVRLSQVHDSVKQGLVSDVVKLARQKGVSGYAADGMHRWSAVHFSDASRLFRLALERQVAGAVYHAVGEEGVQLRDIAEVIARGLKVPASAILSDEVAAHFGWLTKFAGLDMLASSTKTQELLGWNPTGPGLIADLEQMRY